MQDLHDEGSLTQSVETLLPKALHTAEYAKTLGIDSQANMVRFIQIGLHLSKPIEQYHSSDHFEAIRNKNEQVEKKEVLQQILKEMKLKEVA